MKRGYGSQKKRGRPQIARTESTLAPVAGLNTRDPLALMDPSYAINMQNLFATPQGVSVREGFSNHATGMTGYVQSLHVYNGVAAGQDKLFGFANNAIYDVTSSGAVGAAMVTGLTNNLWSGTSMTGSAGNYLVVANGVDAPRHYNGTSWVTWTTVATPSAPGETSGVALSSLNYPITHQRRLWFVQANSTKGYYLPVNSVGGALTAFDFGPVFPRGGSLVQLTSWSFDGGAGINSFLVAVSSEGDVVIYQGTDPSTAGAWTLQSTWRLSAPTAPRCFLQFGGDTLYLSQDGLMPLSKYLQSTTTSVALTDAIQPTVADLSSTQAGLSGFDLHLVPSKNLLILNVPQIDPSANIQFVYHTISKGWSVFNGWPAQCWATLNGITYFGAQGKVCRAFNGYKDGANIDGSGGSIYTGVCQQAFNYFDKRAVKKHFTMARINMITAAGAPNVLIGCNADFNTDPPDNIGSAVPVTGSIWGIALWGSAVWSSGLVNYNAWQTVNAEGYCGSITMAVSVLGETSWLSTEWVYEQGGVLG